MEQRDADTVENTTQKIHNSLDVLQHNAAGILKKYRVYRSGLLNKLSFLREPLLSRGLAIASL